MDVQAAAATATATSLLPGFAQVVPAQPPSTGGSAPASPSAPAPVAVAPASGSDSGSNASNGSANSAASNASANANSTIGPTPGLAILPAGPPDGSKKGSSTDTTLASGVAKLYNVQEQNVSVSFQIEQNPNEIVTVFTDKQTGKVIVQFPSETLIALAKFFDKLDGSVINKKV
jgi:flagellar protein FlaG